ncbi:MAG: hypothetical protein WDM92_16715 [Caulobacteraceae bacterium]
MINNVLRIQAVELGLEPICSTVIHRIVTANNLDGCWRRRAEDGLDIIETPRSEITGHPANHRLSRYLSGLSGHHSQEGLRIDQPSTWDHGGRDHVYLAAEAQVSAFHARKTAQEQASAPIVLKCKMPGHWVADHDVEHQMVKNPLVPGCNGPFFAQEAGLFAASAPIPPADILEVRRPAFNTRYELGTLRSSRQRPAPKRSRLPN